MTKRGTRKLSKAQADVMDRWRGHPQWLIVEARDIGGIWFYKDPIAPLTDRVHRWAFGGLRFRELIKFRESVGLRDYYELTDAGRSALEDKRP